MNFQKSAYAKNILFGLGKKEIRYLETEHLQKRDMILERAEIQSRIDMHVFSRNGITNAKTAMRFVRIQEIHGVIILARKKIKHELRERIAGRRAMLVAPAKKENKTKQLKKPTKIPVVSYAGFRFKFGEPA